MRSNEASADGDRQKFAQAAAAAVQGEQRRIAQALHDTVSQTMTGTYLQALVTARKLQGDGSQAASDVAQLAESIHKAVVELQEITRQLQPDSQTPSD